jgi:hypothetical protein
METAINLQLPDMDTTAINVDTHVGPAFSLRNRVASSSLAAFSVLSHAFSCLARLGIAVLWGAGRARGARVPRRKNMGALEPGVSRRVRYCQRGHSVLPG